MQILLLESQNVDGEILRLMKEIDQKEYSILRGKDNRFQVKGTYEDLANAVGVYLEVMRGFVKDYN